MLVRCALGVHPPQIVNVQLGQEISSTDVQVPRHCESLAPAALMSPSLGLVPFRFVAEVQHAAMINGLGSIKYVAFQSAGSHFVP